MTTQTLKVLSAMLDDLDKEWYGLELCQHSGSEMPDKVDSANPARRSPS